MEATTGDAATGDAATGDAATGDAATGDGARAAFAPRHRRFLRDVAPLITPVERQVFLSLSADYQRDHFIRRFWRVRDPFPQSGRNELQEPWMARVQQARERYGDLTGERAKALLLLGEAPQVVRSGCADVLRPLEIWRYPQGAAGFTRRMALIFVGRQPLGRGPHRLWHPAEGLRALTSLGVLTGIFDDGMIAEAIDQGCARGSLILDGIASSLAIDSIDALLPPSPSDEWALAFRDRSTDVDADAGRLEASLATSFPGRHQSRTVVQGIIRVPRTSAEPAVRGAYRAYGLMVDGEVVARGQLFERFRYRFDMPLAGLGPGDDLPLIVQRYLRPGPYTLVLKVEDLTSGRARRIERTIEVPRIERQPALPREAVNPVVAAQAAVGEAVDVSWLGERLREANAALGTGEHAVQLIRPPRALVVGKLRVVARTHGVGIARVAFAVDGQEVLAKSRPPFSVELDMGPVPRPHVVRARALDADGEELASDEVAVNVGPHRFAVRLIEPPPGRRYQTSLHLHAVVEVPEDERLDRVELFLDDQRLATLYQPPFEQPILLDGSGDLAWLRAAAYLETGAMAEDTVLINAPDMQEEIDVRLVELFTSVVGKRGIFADGLTRADFEVREDGEPQEISRFEQVRDLPIHAALLLDTSLSMLEELRETEKAAYRFLEDVITERDRAAIILFNDAPTLQVRFTNDRSVLAGGLANLKAEGETALFDTLIFGLHYMSGLTGKRTMVMLTDGEDSTSEYDFEDVQTFARHAGVSLYIVALSLPPGARSTRMLLRKLAIETGGGFFAIEHASQLGAVYQAIEQEVRSQYLLAYPSASTRSGFRRVSVKVLRKGLEAKTVAGYFP